MSSELGLQVANHNVTPQPVEQCDVLDKAKLSEYRTKRGEWLGWYQFQADEPNNIEGQIIRMTFLDMSHRMLTKPRTDTPPNVSIAARNGLLSHMLDMGYAATQVLAIRRLLDRRSDVVSLQRLLTDIKSHVHLLTREVYVGHDGKPYDPDGWMSLPPTPETQIWGVDAPGLNNYLMAKLRHEVFDKLSGVPTSARSRTDLISISIFDKLQGWLRSVEAEKLIHLSHKFFAHAASSDNLGSVTDSGVLLSDIERAQRAIVRVERAITDDLLTIGIARNVVAMQPLGFLNGLDLYIGPLRFNVNPQH